MRARAPSRFLPGRRQVSATRLAAAALLVAAALYFMFSAQVLILGRLAARARRRVLWPASPRGMESPPQEPGVRHLIVQSTLEGCSFFASTFGHAR